MPNKLIKEKSPYLQQHAHNPVNWHAWGLEIFKEAQKQDKLVLLSIGYSTCHWCHVMERESFEDEETANIINANFLAIKLDREERPDIDQIYMDALHAMGIQGGWPLNIFLTPDRLPITGGTYFPPKAMYGRPAFKQVLEALARAWKEEREKLLVSAQSIYEFLLKNSSDSNAENNVDSIEDFSFLEKGKEQTIKYLTSFYDSYNGGFLNNGSNKFPPSLQLLFLASAYRIDKNQNYLKILEHTLKKMKQGGIYDQLGGGISRYSTDHDWLVPHFEKMLYDNSLLIWILYEAYHLTKKEEYKKWIDDITIYLDRDMSHPNGSFYSAEDADSEGHEGKFYTWSLEEFQKILNENNFNQDDINNIARFWGVKARGDFEGKNILHEVLDRDSFIEAIKPNTEKNQWYSLIEKARIALNKEREKRIRPFRDEKILTAWNSYAISAYAMIARIPQEKEKQRALILRAQKASDFIWENMYVKDKKLKRRYKDGEACFPACLKDYAALACAFLDLYKTNFELKNLERAIELRNQIIENFMEEKKTSDDFPIFYETEFSNQDLFKRSVDTYDGVEPSSNALCLKLFYTLRSYGIQREENTNSINSILSKLKHSLLSTGHLHSYFHYLNILMFKGNFEIIVLSPDEETNEDNIKDQKIKDWVYMNFSNESMILFAKESEKEAISKLIPALKEKFMKDKQTTIYICKNQICIEPVHSIEEAEHLLYRFE